MNDSILRKELVALLCGKQAHATVEQALADLKPELRNVRPEHGEHSVWEDFEHMRLVQEDILRYTIDQNWVSPPFPDGYWPKPSEPVTEEGWEKSVAAFFADLDELIELAQNPDVDLTAEIPHGEGGHTYLREILLVADHNAYHLGQIVQTRKALGDWGK